MQHRITDEMADRKVRSLLDTVLPKTGQHSHLLAELVSSAVDRYGRHIHGQCDAAAAARNACHAVR
jgi:hypothetical protein